MKFASTVAFATLALAAQFSHAATVDSGSGPGTNTTNADTAFATWQTRVSSFSSDNLNGLSGSGDGTASANLVSSAGNRFQSVAGNGDLLGATTNNTGVISGTVLYTVEGSGRNDTANFGDFRWTLATPSNAFGFFAQDIDGGTMAITFVDGTTQNYSMATVNAQDNDVFWGISGLNSLIASVTISTTNNGGVAYFDRFTTGVTRSAVPEPASLALVGLALLGAAAARRRSA